MFFVYKLTLHALGTHEDDVFKKEISLVGFNSSTTHTLGAIKLHVMAKGSFIMVNFVIIDALAHYTLILEKSRIHKKKGLLSTYHWVIKYLIEIGIMEI